MFESYKIGVTVTLEDHVSGALGLMLGHFRLAEGAAGKLENRLKAIKGLMTGGTLLMGVGAGLAAPLLFATDKAAELQKQLIGIQIATRGSTGEMLQMRKAIEGISGQTIFSNIDVAKQAKLIATGTGLDAGSVTSLLPVFAKFADVQTLMKGTPFTESVTNLIRLAHTAQHYDAPGLTKYADLLTKASLIVPGGLGEVGHALKYSQGIAKTALGVDDEQMVLMTALLNRLGLGGSRGGTNLVAAMSRTIPGVFGSGLLTGKSGEALAAMGMIDGSGHAKVFKDGKFDMVSWMGLMAAYVQKEFASHPEAIARQDIMTNFQHAYGVQGSRVASLLANPQALQQWRGIGETFAQYGGVEGIQQRFANESVAQQYENAKTNFVSAMTELGITLLPTATEYLKKFNTYMQGLITWLTDHPEKVGEYAKNIALFAGAMIGLSVVSTATGAILGLTTAVRGLGAAAAAGGGVGVMGKIGAAIPVAAAGYAIGSWLDDKTGASTYWGNKLTEWFNPEFVNYDPNAKRPGTSGNIERHPDRHIRSAGSIMTAQVHTQVNLDGKKIASVISHHQGKAMTGPQTGGTSYDGRMAVMPAGGF